MKRKETDEQCERPNKRQRLLHNEIKEVVLYFDCTRSPPNGNTFKSSALKVVSLEDEPDRAKFEIPGARLVFEQDEKILKVLYAPSFTAEELMRDLPRLFDTNKNIDDIIEQYARGEWLYVFIECKIENTTKDLWSVSNAEIFENELWARRRMFDEFKDQRKQERSAMLFLCELVFSVER